MPTKKSTAKKTTVKKTKKAPKKPAAKKSTTSAARVNKVRLNNKCKPLFIICLLVLVVCVVCAGITTIYTAIRHYQYIERISSFSLITEQDGYNTVAMDSQYLEIVASDWNSPATEYQLKVDLKNGDTQAVVRKNDTDPAIDTTYRGKISDAVLTKITNSAKAILGNDQKQSFTFSAYATNEALIELCQTVVDDLEDK